MLELSLSQLTSAWERVRDNAGGAGVDGVTVERYEHQVQTALPELLKEAAEDLYRPLPLRKAVIEKTAGSGALRTLLIPAIRDRILQTAVARVLSLSWEDEFLEASYAYRPERGVDRAVARILQLRDRGWIYSTPTFHSILIASAITAC
jgi:retron-type reverse transcriptase